MRHFLLFVALLVFPPLKAGYTLVWQEEFDSLNTEVWTHETGWGDNGWGNAEQQTYTNSPENSYTENSVLYIKSKPIASNNPAIKFSSARIKTEGSVYMLYGKIEARMKLPERGRGVWPAFWMLGENIAEKGWPFCGEIDIMEWRGAEPNSLVSTLHWNGSPTEYLHYDYGKTISLDYALDEDYYIYGVEWTPEKFEFYIIGKNGERRVVNVMDISVATESNGLSCFHSPAFFLLNLAMGGNFGGDTDEGIGERTFAVDWIRVFQDKENFPASQFIDNTKESHPLPYESDCNMLRRECRITSYFAPNWVEQNVAVSGSSALLEIELPAQTYERWQAQIGLEYEDCEIEEGETYDLSFCVSTVSDLKNVLVKVYDGVNDNQYLEGLTTFAVKAGKKRCVRFDGVISPSNMDRVKLLFDFGGNNSAKVKISEIVLQKHICGETSLSESLNNSVRTYKTKQGIVVIDYSANVRKMFGWDGKLKENVKRQE